MMERRITRGVFFGLWAPLLLAQLAILQAAMSEQLALPAGVAAIALLQLAKLPITAFRLNDIGRPASDAVFFVLIPGANLIGLFSSMPERTPSDAAWARRRKGWATQLGPLQAAGRAIPLALKTAGVGVPVAVLYGVGMAAGGWWVLEQLKAVAAMPAASREAVSQGLFVATGLLGIYTLVQFSKRQRASRASWLPSVFFVPVALLAGVFAFFDTGAAGNTQFMLMLFAYGAWQMVWMSVAGAALVVATTLSAEQVRIDGKLDAGSVFGQIGPRTLDVAGPHGARVQAVTIGMQVIIPGIFYMLQLAFTDTIAVLDRDAASLKRSGELTWGMRARLFKLFLVITALSMVAHFVVATLLGSPEEAMAYYINPNDMNFRAFLAGEIVWGLSAWFLQLALFLLYHDRVAYLDALRAERAERKAAKDAAPPADAPAQVST